MHGGQWEKFSPTLSTLESAEFLLLWAIISGQLSSLYIQITAEGWVWCWLGDHPGATLQHPLQQGGMLLGPRGHLPHGTPTPQVPTCLLDQPDPGAAKHHMEIQADGREVLFSAATLCLASWRPPASFVTHTLPWTQPQEPLQTNQDVQSDFIISCFQHQSQC